MNCIALFEHVFYNQIKFSVVRFEALKLTTESFMTNNILMWNATVYHIFLDNF